MKYHVEMPEYNTDRGTMQIGEYGRNIQKMVEVAITEPDRDKRNKLAYALINLMSILNPHLREVADYKHKLWDHLFVISDFRLDVDSPYDKPTPESIAKRPELMPYPQRRIRYRFYGKNIEEMIQKASDMEDGPRKAGFINLIGSFMKQACKNWNEEQLSDEEILSHLELLSGGRIRMTSDEDVQFNATRASSAATETSGLIITAATATATSGATAVAGTTRTATITTVTSAATTIITVAETTRTGIITTTTITRTATTTIIPTGIITIIRTAGTVK
jgi:hypothetical protein